MVEPILHVLAPAEFGGLEQVVLALAGAQAESGRATYAALVVDHGCRGHPLQGSLEEVGVRAELLQVGGREYLRERALIHELCTRVRPSVVHTHGYRPDVVDAWVARELGIATASTVHGFTGNSLRNRFYEAVQRYFLRRFDAVVAVSHPIGQRLIAAGVAPERVHIVPNAWRDRAPRPADEARAMLGLAADRFHLGWVGRLSPEKGPDLMLDALAMLTDLPVHLSVIGDGRLRGPLQEKTAALGLADRVTWHGPLPDAGRLFTGFDAFVLSSRTEGTPIVLFEAMAAGVPIVAARVGGVPDVVDETEALLAAPGSPAELARAVRAVAADPAAAEMRARGARERLAREFALAPWVARHDALYRTITRTSPQPVLA